MTIHTIHTDGAPKPAGHYSQATVHGGLVHVAGQLALDPASGEVVGGADTEAQADQVLRNISAVLKAAGSGLDRVLSLTVFVLTRDDWPGVNAACARAFGAHRPARAIVGGAELKPGCRVEMTAVAALDESAATGG
jgi:2-iminobutanoate/2-iminopropanoate deaminase